ncbi:MAG: DUF721 domain-containing protein [Deltaproteobacteria bacterium]|nr:DUF721 domain-containing protein [Deltaproteobacteria bacterium]
MRRRRYRPSKLTNIGDILQPALKKRGIPVQFEDKDLRDLWLKAVGPTIAAQSRLENRKKDTLVVKVSSSVWMQQLSFLKEEIIEKMNNVLPAGPIKKIRFHIGEISSPMPTQAASELFKTGRPSPLKERDKKMIEETTASLRDPELKDMLKKLMLKEITRRRFMEKQSVKGPRK